MYGGPQAAYDHSKCIFAIVSHSVEINNAKFSEGICDKQ